MGGGSKSESKSTQQSASGSAQQWANPYAVSGVNEIMDVYQSNKPNLEAQSAAANQFSSDLNADFGAASGVSKQGQDYRSDVLSGKFMTGNPWLDAAIKTATGGITDNVNSQFSSAGRYGSGAHTGVLAEKLGEMESSMRYANYGDEMARRDAAAAAADQAKIAAGGLALGGQQAAAELPYTGSESLAQALSALFGGGSSTGTSTSKSSTSPNYLAGLGSIASGAAALSDPRAKHSVDFIAREPDGLGWYEFSYLGSDDRFVGVMADEVAEYRPWALGPRMGGFMTVNYGAL